MLADSEIDFGPDTKAMIEDLRSLVQRAELAVARIEAFEKAANEYPSLVIRCDVDADELRDRIHDLQRDFGYVCGVATPVTDGGTL